MVEKENNNSQLKKDENIDWIVPPGLNTCVDAFIELYNNLYSSSDMRKKPLMIRGDTGVGKSMFIHIFKTLYLKKDSKKIRTLNCATINRNLITGELFGYKKDAFTGAVKDKDGLLKLVDGGLLILEEIGELKKSDQAKLLTFLENGGYYFPIGGTEEERSDVLIISTTNKPKDRFRPDFLSRFIPFDVPAIYKRREDVLYYFYAKYKDLLLSFTKAELLAFLSYNWPGNVREIENLGCLLQLEDKYRENINSLKDNGSHGGSIPLGILHTPNISTSINLPEFFSSFKKNLIAAGIDVNLFERFLNQIGFSIDSIDIFFEIINDDLPFSPEQFEFQEDNDFEKKYGLKTLYGCKKFNEIYKNFQQFCIMLIHPIVKYNIPNTNLLKIEKGDINLSSQRPIKLGSFKPEDLKMQRQICEFRAGIISNDLTTVKSDNFSQQVETVDSEKYVFRKNGDIWKIVFDGHELPLLKDLDGFHYILYLLQYPKEQITPLDLYDSKKGRVQTPAEKVTEEMTKKHGEQEKDVSNSELSVSSGDEQLNTIDNEAKKQYKERLIEINDERQKAEKNNDQATITRLDRETETIEKELRNSGYDKKKKSSPIQGEKARKNVSRRIKYCFEKIYTHNQILGQYLTKNITLGIKCVYSPDPTNPINWQF